MVKALRAALDVELARGHIEEIAAAPVAIVAAIGDRMRGTPGIAATVFGALGAEGHQRHRHLAGIVGAQHLAGGGRRRRGAGGQRAARGVSARAGALMAVS